MKIDGILRVHKPKGITSHDVVHRARRSLSTKEVGHAGTLDPMAEGLLVLLFGQATKISDYILTGDKAYRARVRLGLETDTWDLEGEVLRDESVSFSHDELVHVVQKMSGDLKLKVPAFSAIKKNGKKLYDMAREKQEFELPERSMSFRSCELIESSGNELECKILCSKGSYIRSWAYELGQKLGTVGTLSFLERYYSEPLHLDGAIDFETLASSSAGEIAVSEAFTPLNQCLSQFLAMSLKGRDLRLMTNGQIPNDLQRRLIPLQKEVNREQKEQVLRVFDASTASLLALIEIRPGRSSRIRRVFKSS